MRLTFIICFLCSFAFAQKSYQKNYFENGKLESDGWIENGKKIQYWRFYHSNGRVQSEGHFKNNNKVKFWKTYRLDGKKLSEGHYLNGKKMKWWVFYDKNEVVNHKCQLKDNEKDGYCLMYQDSKLTSAAKYSFGRKIKEWTDFKSFKRENSLRDLQ